MLVVPRVILFRSLKIKLTAWYLLITIVLVAFSGIVAYLLLARGLALKTVYPWDMRAATVEKTADGVVLGEFSEVFNQDGRIPPVKSIRAYTAREINRLASERGSVMLNTLQGPIALDAGALVTPDMGEDTEIWIYLYSWPDQPGVYQLLQVNQTAEARHVMLLGFRKAVLITAGLAMGLAAVLGFLVVWRGLRPLADISRAAGGISGANLAQRIQSTGSKELDELSSSLNSMLDRVEGAFDSERQAASDLSHELRTPLAVMQVEAAQALKKERGDLAYQKALETVTREVSHVSSVAGRLLFLARSEHGSELSMAPVNLKDLVTEVGWDAEVLCEDKGITFRSDVSDPAGTLIVDGDKTRLRELLLNLLNNGVRYTPAGGEITLSLMQEPTPAGRGAKIALSDTGIGIPEKHLPHIFERFYRVDRSSNAGNGLGLAICKRICELHGGSITVKSKPGSGTTFFITLPLSGAVRSGEKVP